MSDWNRRFMDVAENVAEWSKDRSHKVGCVIVGPNREIRSTGYNGFPRGVNDDVEERHQRPAKYLWTEHAERNAIYNAARVGVPLAGCKIYVQWYPCADCARSIVQVGIVELICYKPDWHDKRWAEHFAVTALMLDEAGVNVVYVATS